MLVSSEIIPALGLFLGLTTATYTLQDDYGTNQTFFSKFDFFTSPDPTHGYVEYVDRATAQSAGLISASSGSVYLGVDTSNVASSPGRQSVRLTSKKAYNHGLVILDLEHMPGSVCGSWPAFWMIGTVPPTAGEIDIIEGISDYTTNEVTLHTNEDGCSIQNSGFSGSLDTSECYIYTKSDGSGGCGIIDPSKQSYGDGFNAAGGGVFATEWTSDGVHVWRFSNSSIPADISSGRPNPSTWGTPVASFAGNCDFDAQFNNLHIVFDITFCGDWAGSEWSSDSCTSKAPTCQDFVQNHPKAFTESYWRVRSLKVYTNDRSTKRSAGTNTIPKVRRRGGHKYGM
ncbi:Endo-1-3(4)-beta-glucanase [Penicillium chermesinum]|uniref:endo-1,3(4)-beta-glucanase n=1 Tax=Penicillium chermesinum TaxID=63820 RepID=A0A9W9TYA0_9EURO|nr:Endo-1-3(4)-beta-glucanase [Penicillium chermesinum]KAJ5247762.1 Endo-1-3(4)-beta-glucanase [Penicillium chermesinum]